MDFVLGGNKLAVIHRRRTIKGLLLFVLRYGGLWRSAIGAKHLINLKIINMKSFPFLGKSSFPFTREILIRTYARSLGMFSIVVRDGPSDRRRP